MNENEETWLATVVRCLQETKGKWRSIADATGIPYDTLTKIALGRVADPRVSNVEALFNYFSANTKQPAAADCAHATH